MFKRSTLKRGVTALSYGLLVGLIAVVALGAITSSGESVDALMTDVADAMTGVAATPEATATATATPTPTVLIPGNTTVVVTRNAIEARCAEWSGNTCTQPQFNYQNISSWEWTTPSTTAYDSDTFWGVAGDSSGAERTDTCEAFCRIATGSTSFSLCTAEAGINGNGTDGLHTYSESCPGCNSGIYGYPLPTDWNGYSSGGTRLFMCMSNCGSHNYYHIVCDNW